MRAGEWTALLVAVAGVVATLATVPALSYRIVVLVLILLALLVAIHSLRRRKPPFAIATPRPDQDFNGGGGSVVVSGTVSGLESDTLWIFENGLIDGKRVWYFGGEGLVDGNTWSFDYEPRAVQAGRIRRTLSVVRADRRGERQLRSVRPDAAGRLVVYDPPPGGCEVVGQISLYLTTQP